LRGENGAGRLLKMNFIFKMADAMLSTHAPEAHPANADPAKAH
jgi:hypothetical protein